MNDEMTYSVSLTVLYHLCETNRLLNYDSLFVMPLNSLSDTQVIIYTRKKYNIMIHCH